MIVHHLVSSNLVQKIKLSNYKTEQAGSVKKELPQVKQKDEIYNIIKHERYHCKLKFCAYSITNEKPVTVNKYNFFYH